MIDPSGALSNLPMGEQVFLIDLDALLDTRLAVAATIDEAAFNEIALHPGYATRESDDLSLFTDRFTKEEYETAWANRDASCLSYALITNYLRELAKTSATLHRILVDKNNPNVQRIEFVINTHPYELTKDTRFAIEDAVRHYVMPGCEVSSCRLPYNVLNFAYIREHYSTLVIYNFRDWMEKCEPQDYEGPGAPQVTVMAPALFGPDGKPTPEEIRDGLHTDDPVDNNVLFGLTEYTLSYVMTLAFQDPVMFSIVAPKETK